MIFGWLVCKLRGHRWRIRRIGTGLNLFNVCTRCDVALVTRA